MTFLALSCPTTNLSRCSLSTEGVSLGAPCLAAPSSGPPVGKPGSYSPVYPCEKSLLLNRAGSEALDDPEIARCRSEWSVTILRFGFKIIYPLMVDIVRQCRGVHNLQLKHSL